jgi:hypothetical protein
VAALLAYGVNADTGVTQFAIVTDDTQARYVWPALGEPIWADDRAKGIADTIGISPATAGEWMDVAAYNLGLTTQFTDPTSVPDLSAGVTEARLLLNQGRANVGSVGSVTDPLVLNRAREAFDQTSADYPGFGEDEMDDDPEAMTNFVLQMLGGIDPTGPNAWILEQAANPDPNAEPGGFVHLPGYDYNLPVTVPDETAEPTPDGDE